MKFFNRIKATLFNTRESVERFPITILMSVLLVILLIYFNENRFHMDSVAIENLSRLNMTVGMGIPLSLCIVLLIESLEKKNKLLNIVLYGLGAIFLVLLYFLILDKLRLVQISRYLGTFIFFILAFFYIPKIHNEKTLEKYVIKIFSGGFLTAIYSGVLFLGLTAILFTIDSLFDVNINSKYYFYLFLIVVFIFGISLFLSKIPKRDENLDNQEYSKSLKVLLVYIVIPLLIAYNLILYAYFIKILITWQWPKGLVSHLVLWSSALSIGVIFLITPVLEENKLAKVFKIWFPKAVLPILVMMFISIWQRVNQYGITENRYYIIIFGLWIFGIMLYFSFKKPLRNIFIPISLSIIVLISIYGPLSSFSFSIRSQNNRLNNILVKNGFLYEGKIISKPDTPNEVKKEINNIIYYFDNTHTLNDIHVLPKDFKISDVKNVFGFEYVPLSSYNPEQNYFYYNMNPFNKTLNISGYDYYVNMSSWNNQSLSIDDITIGYNSNNHILTIKRGNTLLLEQDMITFVRDIYDKKKGINEKFTDNIEDMTYISENDNIKAEFIFTSISGRANLSDDITIESLEFVLLIDIK